MRGCRQNASACDAAILAPQFVGEFGHGESETSDRLEDFVEQPLGVEYEPIADDSGGSKTAQRLIGTSGRNQRDARASISPEAKRWSRRSSSP